MKYELLKHRLQGISLIISAIATLLPTFFMRNQEFTIIAGVIIILTTPFNIFGFAGIYEKFKEKMPLYANWGLLLFLFGQIAGVNFGIRGVFSEIFGISLSQLEAATSNHIAVFTILFFAIGPAFPLSIIILGINLLRKKLVHKTISIMLIAGGIIFPLSRISRIEAIMHLSDLFIAVPILLIAINMLQLKNNITSSKANQYKFIV